MDKKRIELEAYSSDGEWPRCFYKPDLRCGDPKAAADEELVRRNWHVANMCECPSCPLRVAIAAALRLDEQK